MKKLQLILAVIALAATSYAQSDAHKMFDQVRALEGSWSGKTADGMDVKVTFRSTAGGSAVMSEILSDRHGPDLMVTMFTSITTASWLRTIAARATSRAW